MQQRNNLRVLDGVNCVLIGYGQTGSGKSFTIGGLRNNWEVRLRISSIILFGGFGQLIILIALLVDLAQRDSSAILVRYVYGENEPKKN